MVASSNWDAELAQVVVDRGCATADDPTDLLAILALLLVVLDKPLSISQLGVLSAKSHASILR
jgi:hypothetical protein